MSRAPHHAVGVTRDGYERDLARDPEEMRAYF
jgi:hypothetical protein